MLSVPPLSRNTLRFSGYKLFFYSSVLHSYSTKSVTKKNYQDLPIAQTLRDGSIAPPLKPWDGGLEPSLLEELPKKRRKGKTDSQVGENDACTPTPENVLEIPDVTRPKVTIKKKKKRDEETLQVLSSPDGKTISEDGNVSPEANEVPKQHRRVSKSSEDELGGSKSRQDIPTPADVFQRPASTARKRRKVNQEVDDPSEDVRLPKNDLAVIILDNLAKFPHCILLTRVGNFYESYFDQAAEVARLLSIKLTKRTWDRQEVLMCGFPIMHLDRHLKVLVQGNKRCVALCEEFRKEPPEMGFTRRVARVLTPGTLFDESFLNPYENNYLLAIHAPPSVADGHISKKADASNDLGLAWIDVSTGEFFSGSSALEGLKDELARIAPREVVINATLADDLSHPLRQILADERCFVSYGQPQEQESLELSLSHITADDIVGADEEVTNTIVPSSSEATAINLLTNFLQEHLLEHMPSLSHLARTGTRDRMQIDSHTIKALEIREEMREGGVSGSLLSAINRTITSSGARLLGRWLCSPSTSVREIEARQNLVSIFQSRPHLRADITQHLKRLEDSSRIVQRFLLGKGDISDLLAIKNAIEIWVTTKDKIEGEYNAEIETATSSQLEEWSDMMTVMGRLVDLTSLADRIGLAVTSSSIKQLDGPELVDASEGEEEMPDVSADIKATTNTWLSFTNWSGGQLKPAINPKFSAELLALHEQLAAAQAAKERLEQDLQRRFDAPSLTLRSAGKYRIHVHIAKAPRDVAKLQESDQFSELGSSASTKAYFNKTWHKLGIEIEETVLKILIAERTAFEELRREINADTLALRRNGRIMDELDVTIGFANLASEMSFVRPSLDESKSYHVAEGRHPVVELGLLGSGRTFIPNTVSLKPDCRLHIITGPNMAGKSTLLRQTAILAILAQIGSFIPAGAAQLGIVDKVFSRIGAKDDLFRDRSTFMVEMLETTEILKNATERSLVIMDEVGRGTTVRDGLAIAFATVHHLYTHNRCRALFATHFHEIIDLLGYKEGQGAADVFKDIGFFCTDVDETMDGHFAYSHKLREGVNRDSHGLKVARLAGMPKSALQLAQDTLQHLNLSNDENAMNSNKLRAVGKALLPPP